MKLLKVLDRHPELPDDVRLGLHDAEKLKIKAGLVIEIRKAMQLQGLTQPVGHLMI